MCNRVATPDYDDLHGYFDKQEVNQRQLFEIKPYEHYYNADAFTMPFLPLTANDSPNVVAPAMWKLLPYWIQGADDAKKAAHTFNARSEEIFEKASYKNYIKKNRALLWVSGFFEPNHPEKKVTIPYFIRAHNSEPFTLGCVYSDWTNRDTGEVIRTFSIITTPPNELLTRIHNEGQRMPLIITPDQRAKWLGKLSDEEIREMMKPLPDGYLEGYPVGNIVYKRGVNQNVPEAQIKVTHSNTDH